MSTPHKCPVCDGAGKVMDCFKPVECAACHGTCVVWEPEVQSPTCNHKGPIIVYEDGPVHCAICAEQIGTLKSDKKETPVIPGIGDSPYDPDPLPQRGPNPTHVPVGPTCSLPHKEAGLIPRH